MTGQRAIVDGFELLGELGRGAMGAVYRARHQASGRMVAFKVVLGTQSPQRLARLTREGELTAGLNHPGIVRIHGAGQHQGRPYLAYELIEGVRDWDEVIRSSPLEARVERVRDAARALGAAHAQGIVHRDVKPDNLLIGEDGRVRVADFGLAVAQDLDRLTQTGAFVGTPNYMAPERFDPRRVGNGPEIDVWSLGVLLYAAITEELPYNGETLVSLVSNLNAGPPERPRSLNSEISADLEAVCLSALAREVEDRYPDGAALADDLDRVLAGEPVQARGARALRLGARWIPLALAPLVGVAVLGFALVYEPEPPASTVSQAPVGPVETAPEEASDEDDDSVTVDPKTHSVEELREAFPGVGIPEDVDPEIADKVVSVVKSSVEDAVKATRGDETREGKALAAYHRGRLMRKIDPPAALENYKQAAELGHAEAAYEAAMAYRKGEGAPKDKRVAHTWMLKAAQGGVVAAMQEIGEDLHKGKFCERDRWGAHRWWLKAAELGDRPSMLRVAREFRRGEYLEKSLAKAEFWEKAALAKQPD